MGTTDLSHESQLCTALNIRTRTQPGKAQGDHQFESLWQVRKFWAQRALQHELEHLPMLKVPPVALAILGDFELAQLEAFIVGANATHNQLRLLLQAVQNLN